MSCGGSSENGQHNHSLTGVAAAAGEVSPPVVTLNELRQMYAREELEQANVEEIPFHRVMQMSVLSPTQVALFRQAGFLTVPDILTENQCQLLGRTVVKVLPMLVLCVPPRFPYYICFVWQKYFLPVFFYSPQNIEDLKKLQTIDYGLFEKEEFKLMHEDGDFGVFLKDEVLLRDPRCIRKAKQGSTKMRWLLCLASRRRCLMVN